MRYFNEFDRDIIEILKKFNKENKYIQFFDILEHINYCKFKDFNAIGVVHNEKTSAFTNNSTGKLVNAEKNQPTSFYYTEDFFNKKGVKLLSEINREYVTKILSFLDLINYLEEENYVKIVKLDYYSQTYISSTDNYKSALKSADIKKRIKDYVNLTSLLNEEDQKKLLELDKGYILVSNRIQIIGNSKIPNLMTFKYLDLKSELEILPVIISIVGLFVSIVSLIISILNALGLF